MPDVSTSVSKRRQDEEALTNSNEKKPKLAADLGTSLHVAAMKGFKGIILQHIENGSDLSAKDHSGWTPLHLALQYNYIEIAVLLVNHGADLKAKNAQTS